eukprot:Skav213569  [mRNA]  locus=scaffold3492:88129:89364:+ [translate_table: standard]
MFHVSHALCLGQKLPATLSRRIKLTESLCRGFVTFPAAQFQHLWADVGATALPYNGHPLVRLSGARRGAVLEKWARQMLQERYPNCVIEDAVPGTCVNGARRGWYRAEYDFTLDERKVEIKSAQLKWLNSASRWGFLFQGIKLNHSSGPDIWSFDDLYLALFSPKWLHLVRHDLRTAVSAAGLATNSVGHHVQVRGKTNSGWEESLEHILSTLCTVGNCELLGRTDVSNSFILAECQQNEGYGSKFYHNVPFSSMSPQLRGIRVEKLLREVDELINPDCDFSMPDNELTCSGAKRAQHTASVDWLRDHKRIEAKSSQMYFSTATQRWRCGFQTVKENCFDELLLAIYSPRGLDIFKHDGSFGLTSKGIRPGKDIWVSARSGELDPMRALQTIEQKLQANNCPKLASIPWDT